MRPDVVTFWHGPLDRLRTTCLRSQVAAGHKVTVYSFDPLPGLPDGVGNAEAEAILPHSFSERLRPPEPDGSWRDWTILQFSDFFRMRLMAERAGLWLDADVLLLKPIEIVRQATTVAAKILRQEGKLGIVEPGALADFIVVDGDPLKKLELFLDQGAHLPAIMKAGKFHKNTLS